MAGWPCPVLTFPGVDYKGVQGELCYCLQPWYLIACYRGALKSHALPYNIDLCLRCQWHLNKHNWRPVPLLQCNSHPKSLIEVRVFLHKRLSWNVVLLPQALKTTSSHFFCRLSNILFASLEVLLGINTPSGELGGWGWCRVAKPNEWIIQHDFVQYDDDYILQGDGI